MPGAEKRTPLIEAMRAETPALAAPPGFRPPLVLECAGDGSLLVEGRRTSFQGQRTRLASPCL